MPLDRARACKQSRPLPRRVSGVWVPRLMPLLIDPFISFDTIEREEMNKYLVAWEHQMGPIERPEYRRPLDFVLREHGEPVAVIASDTLIRDTCDFTRNEAFELSRLCAAPSRHGLCSMTMKLWRHFAYPVIAKAWKTPWVISYQDAARHTGTLYRFDHWLILGYSTSGTDPRARPGTTSVRRKVIWGWNADAAAMADRRAIEIKKPTWSERKAA